MSKSTQGCKAGFGISVHVRCIWNPLWIIPGVSGAAAMEILKGTNWECGENRDPVSCWVHGTRGQDIIISGVFRQLSVSVEGYSSKQMDLIVSELFFLGILGIQFLAKHFRW